MAAARSGTEGKVTTLLLVGKTRNGKSSTGNTILRARDSTAGSDPFSTAVGFKSNTTQVEVKQCKQGSRVLKVINTPDLNIIHGNDSQRDSEEKQGKKKKKTSEEVREWLAHADGKPDAVLLLIRADCRYTREEYEIYQHLKAVLESSMKDKKHSYRIRENLVIAFTMGDNLSGRDLRKDLQDASGELKEVLNDACQRYVLFNNKAEDWEKEATVDTLLKIVDTKKPHPFPQQVCRLLLDGELRLQRAIAAILCPQADKDPDSFFYYSLPKQSSDDEFGGLKLEVTLTPETEDEEAIISFKKSISPGPHVILTVTELSANPPRQIPSQILRKELPKSDTYALLIVDAKGSSAAEANIQASFSKSVKPVRVVVLPDRLRDPRDPRDARGRLLTAIKNLVAFNKGQHWKSGEMDELADELQDTLSSRKHQVSYQEYVEEKKSESERRMRSFSAPKTTRV